MTVSVEATDHGYSVSRAYYLTLEADGPILNEVKKGEISSFNLAESLFGGLDESSDHNVGDQFPRIDWSDSGHSSVVRMTMLFRYPPTESLKLEIEDSTDADDSDELSRRNLTVTAEKGLDIVGVSNSGNVAHRDDSEIVFAGGPTESSAITIEASAAVRNRLGWPQTIESSAPEATPEADDSGDKTNNPAGLLLLASGWNVLISALVLAVPWLALRKKYAIGDLTTDRATFVRKLSLIALVVSGVGALGAVWGDATSTLSGIANVLSIVPLSTAVVALTLSLARMNKTEIRRRSWLWRSFGGAAAVWAMSVATMIASDTFTISSLLMGISSVPLAAASGACLAAARVRSRALVGAAAGAFIASVSALLVTLSFSSPSSSLQTCGFAVVGVAFLGVVMLSLRNGEIVHARPVTEVAIVVVAGAILFIPIWGLFAYGISGLSDVGYSNPMGDWLTPVTITARVMQLSLIVAGLIYLWRTGGRTPDNFDRFNIAIAFGIFLALQTDLGNGVWWKLVAVGYAAMVWFWFMPSSRLRDAAQLAGTTSAQHRRILSAELRTRLAQLSAHDLYRTSRKRLSEGELSLSQYDDIQHRLDDASRRNGKEVAKIPLSLAMATNAGQTPRDNAVSAVYCVAPAAILLIGFEALGFAFAANVPWASLSVLDLCWTLLGLARWILYALLYGYFYPIIRGTTPIAKAVALLVLLTPPELLAVLAGLSDDQARGIENGDVKTIFLSLALRTGQILLFCAVLGLAWERRMVHLGGFGWDRLRNIRSFRTLATPISTIIVAVVTTFGTALAGWAVATMLSNPQAPQAPSQKANAPTTSPAPSPSGSASTPSR